MIRRYPPNRMLSILLVLLAMAAYFSYDLYTRETKSNKPNLRFQASPISNVSPQKALPQEAPPKTSNTEVQGSRPESNIIRPGAVLIFENKYTECGHVITSKLDIPQDMVNLTENQLKLVYKNWEIKKFSPLEIILSKKIDSKCYNHFILKEKDGFVAVYYQQPIDGISLKEVTPLLVKNLPLREMQRLKEGIKIESQEELAQTLEDLGS